jgi:hypothetical protein
LRACAGLRHRVVWRRSLAHPGCPHHSITGDFFHTPKSSSRPPWCRI